MRENNNVYFLWVGCFESSIEHKVKEQLDDSEYSDRFIFPGWDFESDIYFAGSDIYALTSREDPFPSVVMEALDVGVPVIAFHGAGGFTELLARGCGHLVHAFDTHAYAQKITQWLEQPETAQVVGKAGRKIIEDEFSFRHYLFDLIDLVDAPVKRVSVIVPNFNYARYLPERIASIVQQDYPIYEIIVLDDASTDESIEVLENLLGALHIDCKLVKNECNSGNPFAQWFKGVEMASGDYVWIAEADDLAEPEFLVEVLNPFADPSVVMSYCQSMQIDSNRKILCKNYLEYVSDISSEKWLQPYVEDGRYEISTCLAIKNAIPNVSGAIFKREVLFQCMKDNLAEIKKLRGAGDWLTYLYVLERGKIAFTPNPLNRHCRHEQSIIAESPRVAHLEEILAVQQWCCHHYELDEVAKNKAHAFLQNVYEHFDLASTGVPLWEDHPSLKKYACRSS